MRKHLFSVLQKIGKSLMVPVSVLPAAGLLVALGRVFQGYESQFVHALGDILFSGGLAIFEQLPLIFAIGVAIGFAGGAGIAGLASAVGYFTMTNIFKVMDKYLSVGVEGYKAINTGVFGAIVIGLLAAMIYKRFQNLKLPTVLGFFGGKRSVPIITAFTAFFVALALGFIWPPIQAHINTFGGWAMGSEFGPALYAAGKRLLIPVGLHHVYYPPFMFEFGQFVSEAGTVLKGDSARFFAGDATAGIFMAAEYPIMLFGLPAATLAMYFAAPSNRRKMIAGMMVSAALTSIITGITEPIEFAFIFVAPLLYVLHVIFAFISGYLTSMFDIHLGYTFSASIIDYVLGFANAKNSVYLFCVVGPIMFGTYFTAFYLCIKKFNFLTPGRDESADDIETGINPTQKAAKVLAYLGGSENIANLDACITRLRVSVKDGNKVNSDGFKSLGAAGVMNAGNGNFQIVFGPEADSIKDQVQELINNPNAAIIDEKSSTKSVEKVSVAGKRVLLKTPIAGEVVSIQDVPDQTFAGKLLGDGIAINPTDGVVYAPVKGKIVQLFKTNHAICINSEEGASILIHVGIDTVKMGGNGFKAFVENGDEVEEGQKLLEFDIELIKKEAKSVITPIVITNMDEINTLKVMADKSVNKGHDLIELELK